MMSRKLAISAFLTAVIAVLIVNGAAASGGHDHGAKNEGQKEKAKSKKDDAAKLIKQQLPYYPLKNCVVMKKEKLTKESINHLYKGRLVRFCCDDCKDSFSKSPAKYLKKLDAAVIEAQLKNYPLDTCVVLGGKLGGMGKPINFVHNNRLVRFCCAGCKSGFLKNPDKYLAKIDAVMKKKDDGKESGKKKKDDPHKGHKH